jgi:hypothetical protein
MCIYTHMFRRGVGFLNLIMNLQTLCSILCTQETAHFTNLYTCCLCIASNNATIVHNYRYMFNVNM